jgi:hypothetical protein
MSGDIFAARSTYEIRDRLAGILAFLYGKEKVYGSIP